MLNVLISSPIGLNHSQQPQPRFGMRFNKRNGGDYFELDQDSFKKVEAMVADIAALKKQSEASGTLLQQTVENGFKEMIAVLKASKVTAP